MCPGDALYIRRTESVEGKAVKIGRLYATQCGAARCVLPARPEPHIIPIHRVFRGAGLTRIVDNPRAGSEAAPLVTGEPTF